MCSVSLVQLRLADFVFMLPTRGVHEEGVPVGMTAKLTRSPSHPSYPMSFDSKAFILARVDGKQGGFQIAQQTSTSIFDTAKPHP